MEASERKGMEQIEVVAMKADHIESFHQALDMVAKERSYLTMLEAFPLPETRKFALNMMKQGNPQVVATAGNRVVGWCDISRHFFPSHAHRGTLGMGIIRGYRNQGVGHRLITAALAQARTAGLIRIELSVRADNSPAMGLYEKVGFVREGVHRRSVFVDGCFFDSVNMALMLDGR